VRVSWPKVKLADCVDLLAGFAFKSDQYTSSPDDIALVKGENVSQGRILWDIAKRWPASDWQRLEKYQLQPGDVVVAMDRPWIPAGLKWAFIRKGDPAALLVQRCSRLRASNGNLDQDFLRFVIGGPGFENYVRPITTGVNVPHISGTQILGFEFELPPLPLQRRIAAILSAYDDLVENCQRRIRILEEMARSLYREWFVDFRFPGHKDHPRVPSPLGEIPEGWEVRRVDEALDFRSGKPIKKSCRQGGVIPVYGANGVIGSTDNLPMAQRCIIMGKIGSCGALHRSETPCWVTNNAFLVSPAAIRSIELSWQVLSNINFGSYVGGAANPYMPINNFGHHEVIVPATAVQAEYESRTSHARRLVVLLSNQIATLRRTRDLLLPRLLSGQVDLEALG